MEAKLETALSLFQAEMWERLEAKEVAGFTGWDEMEQEELRDRLFHSFEHGKYIDVANFAMFLHNYKME